MNTQKQFFVSGEGVLPNFGPGYTGGYAQRRKDGAGPRKKEIPSAEVLKYSNFFSFCGF